jgi:hypothetical protein
MEETENGKNRNTAARDRVSSLYVLMQSVTDFIIICNIINI